MSGIINTITEKVASLTTSDSTPATAPTDVAGDQPGGPSSDAVAASVAEGRRLYVGNLAYAATEEQLKTFFNGYNVESTSIPTNPRTSRPVGYAFVDLATAAEADKAIAELSGQDILERKVSVQLARNREPAAPKELAAAAEGADTNGDGIDGARRRGSGRGRGRTRAARGGRGGRARNGEEAVPGSETAAATVTTTEPVSSAAGETTQAATTDKTKTTAPPKERRQRGPPDDGIPSKTKVMVANLPYNLSEESLKELFSAYQPTAAKIALRPIPRFMVRKLQARNEPRKGRGFGFVTLPSEELQQKAVSEMNGKEVDGREIAVKVAIDSPGREDEPLEGEAAAGAGVNGDAAPVAAA